MKTYILSLAALFISVSVFSQYQYDWKEFGLIFQSKNKYDFESLLDETENGDSLWRMDCLEFGVEVEACALSEESDRFIKNIKYAAKEIAKDMAYRPISKGGEIPGDFRGYYVITSDIDYYGKKYPVLVAAIIDDKNELAFEIVIDCYDGDLESGVAFLTSVIYQPKEMNH